VAIYSLNIEMPLLRIRVEIFRGSQIRHKLCAGVSRRGEDLESATTEMAKDDWITLGPLPATIPIELAVGQNY
jgi:hypothetical protein